MSWAGHVACMGEEEMCIRGFWLGKLRRRDHMEDPGINGRLRIKWIFRTWELGAWTGLSWLRIGTSVGHL